MCALIEVERAVVLHERFDVPVTLRKCVCGVRTGAYLEARIPAVVRDAFDLLK